MLSARSVAARVDRDRTANYIADGIARAAAARNNNNPALVFCMRAPNMEAPMLTIAEMQTSGIVSLVIRFAHILFAVLLAGGTLYQCFVVQPALRGLDEDRRRDLQDRLGQHWRKLLGVAVAVLLISGLLNFLVVKAPLYKEHPQKMIYYAIFGFKLLAALGVFHALTVLSGPGERFEKYRARAGFWLTYASVLLVVVILLGGVMSNFSALFG